MAATSATVAANRAVPVASEPSPAREFVEVEGLRVGQLGIRDGSMYGGPIGGKPAAQRGREIAGAEVIIAGFRVAFFAGIT